MNRPFLMTPLCPVSHINPLSYYQTPEWENEVKRSKFNLAPRGWGRTSYRLAEIVQLGR